MINKQPTAIVIDDTWENQLIFTSILKKLNVVTESYTDSTQGLEALSTKTYDLMILDLSMPKISGNQILKKIRPGEFHKKMKIVVVTAYAHMAIGQDIDEGADYLMLKPISVPDFTRFLTKVLPKQIDTINNTP